MRFDEYNIVREIKENLRRMEYKKPTDIQFKAIPSILKGEDVLAIAQTGTGKTAAFAIPIIHMLHHSKQRKRPDGIKCIVMAPTHELALQLTGVFEQIAKHTRVKIVCVIGGEDQAPQIESLEKGADILIATPGRMFDLLSQGHFSLRRVEILVLDEADHMLDLGFIKDIQDLTGRLSKRRQTLFFSATIDAKIKKLAYSLVHNPIRIQISPKDPVAKNITHSVAFIEMDDKRFFLERLVKENPDSKILVFVRTIVRAERVAKAMERVEISSQTIHREKTQEERREIMQNFSTGQVKLLIATDISARGIDIPNVDYVINYDLPEQSENYVHRVGRTGRGREKGLAVSFCSPDERETLKEIESYLENPIQVLEIHPEEYIQTRQLELENKDDWAGLMQEAKNQEDKRRKGKKKKGRRKA